MLPITVDSEGVLRRHPNEALRVNCMVPGSRLVGLRGTVGRAVSSGAAMATRHGTFVAFAARARVFQIVSCSVALLLCACAASGPTIDKTTLYTKAVPDDKARVVFFRTRDSALYIARRAAISLDGEKIGGIGYGGFFFQDIDTGNHGLRADMWDMPGRCELMFTAAAGETYYFQVDPRSESLGAFASGDMATQFFTSNVLVNIVGGVSAVAAESYGKDCAGAFRIYPVDAGTAITRLGPLRLAD